ncbi:BQ5605_C003g02326 [Microbotryum silenes-dioicae]|uniref:BQ5605_C003g02326 protein n=1 Tax=Microbotryum silenes-dioicae TaxID=796604 RepID=A0A2X0NYL0_9BASI|nr:BQ5605_C003g02326 [Microbotryum silenes-dioicae]
MFRCTGYGECSMVFTRSEHLARHVRKHTGERPFKCHCGRLFSRLDNVRQHATTVHADDAELNTQMMKELTALHNQLSASTAQRQVAMGMVVKEDSDALPRKPKAPTDPNKPRAVRRTKAKVKRAREGAALESAATDATAEPLTESPLAVTAGLGGSEGQHPDSPTRDRVSQADDEEGGNSTEFHHSDMGQASPPPPPQPLSAVAPTLQQRFMSGPYPPSSGGHYPPAASYNSYAYDQGPATSFAGYGNPSSPQNGLGTHLTSGSPPLRRRIAPPQPPVPAPPTTGTSRFNTYNAPYSYSHQQIGPSTSAASHSSSAPPSPPGSLSGSRSGVTLPSISNLLPSPFGSTRDVSENVQPPGFNGSEEPPNTSSQHAVEGPGGNARTGAAHAGRGPPVMGSSNYSLSGVGNGTPYSSDSPTLHNLAAGMTSSAQNQTNAYDYPESHTHVNYDTAPYHDGSEAGVMQSATYAYNNSGHAILPSHQYLKHLQSRQGISSGLAHHQPQPASYHLAPPPHHVLTSYSAPGSGSNSFQDHEAGSMGASDGHYYGAGTTRLYSPNSRESSERSSIGSWAPPPPSVHQNHGYQGASGMQMVDHHAEGMSAPRRGVGLGGLGARPALEDDRQWRRASGPQAR